MRCRDNAKRRHLTGHPHDTASRLWRARNWGSRLVGPLVGVRGLNRERQDGRSAAAQLERLHIRRGKFPARPRGASRMSICSQRPATLSAVTQLRDSQCAALAVQYQALVTVGAGPTLGMTIANVPAVRRGDRLAAAHLRPSRPAEQASGESRLTDRSGMTAGVWQVCRGGSLHIELGMIRRDKAPQPETRLRSLAFGAHWMFATACTPDQLCKTPTGSFIVAMILSRWRVALCLDSDYARHVQRSLLEA